MRDNALIHIPHSSLVIPDEYRKTSLLDEENLDRENLLMCDFRMDQLIDDKSKCVVFPYSRLYCDVERFRDDSEIMNQFGMGYIYTRTSDGTVMFHPSASHIKKIDKIYDEYHKMLDDRVSDILGQYGECFIIDLHSYSSDVVEKLFGCINGPDICIGVEDEYSSSELVDYFVDYFSKCGYSVKINYPYSGSFVPNKYYGKKNTGIVSIMIEVNKRVYEDDFDGFKKILVKVLKF